VTTTKNSSDLTFYIETLGCPKNRADSRKMRSSFLSLGYKEAQQAENADFFLINSCSFIREAQEETIQTVFDALKIREKKSPTMKVGLIGCFVERFSSEVKKEIPELDFTIGTQRYHEVGGLISEKFGITTTGHAALEREEVSQNPDSHKPFSWLRIAQGCNRHCAFCIIPQIRGPLKTYEIEAVEKQLTEEKNLRGKNGIPIQEVILVSQDTISQGVEAIESIIAHLSEKEDIHWIRLQYLFPDRRVLDLLKLWEKYPKLTPYLDIPFQHVSPTVLKAMKRPSDVELFSEIIGRAHSIREDFEIRTSFIVGFPGEGIKEFNALENFLEKHRIDKLALFRYSHEKGTYAGDKLVETLGDEEKYRRINKLREQHILSRKKYATGLIGKTEMMIVDEVGRAEVTLRRAHDAPESDEVVMALLGKNKLQVGQMPKVTIKAYTEYAFIGEIVPLL